MGRMGLFYHRPTGDASGGGRIWDDDFLGARASRPHKAWHSFACLPHFDQPGRMFVVYARVRRRGRKRRQVLDTGETPALPGDAVRLRGRARDMPRQSWGRSDGAARQGPAKFVEGDAAGDDEDVAVGGQLTKADRYRHPDRPLEVESER